MISFKTTRIGLLLVLVILGLSSCDIGLTVSFTDPLPCTVNLDSSVETVSISTTSLRSFYPLSISNNSGQASRHQVDLRTSTSFEITQFYYDSNGVYRQKTNYFTTPDKAGDSPAVLLIQGAAGISFID